MNQGDFSGFPKSSVQEGGWGETHLAKTDLLQLGRKKELLEAVGAAELQSFGGV